jgi:hypothetical protein
MNDMNGMNGMNDMNDMNGMNDMNDMNCMNSRGAGYEDNAVEPSMENTKSELCYRSGENDMMDETKKFAGMERCDYEKGECSVCSMKYANDPDVVKSLNETSIHNTNCVIDHIDHANEAYVKHLKE